MTQPSNPTNLLLHEHDEVAVDQEEHSVQLPTHETQLALLYNNAAPLSSSGETETETLMMSPILFAAAMNGKLGTIRENESYLSTQFTRTGNSVLHIASEFGQLGCVQEIIQLRVNGDLVKKTNNKGETALHVAAERGHSSIVMELVNFAATAYPEDDVEEEIREESVVKELLRMKNKKGSTALHEAARYGWDGVVEYLSLKDPNFAYGPNLCGETPLYIAAERGHQKAAIAILRTCNSPSYEGPLGRTALHAAVISNCGEDQIWTGKKMMTTRHHNHSSSVTQLLSYDENLAYIPDETGMIPLHVAGSRGNFKAIQSLISKCPDCYDMVDKKGRNVIHHAVLNNQLGTVHEISIVIPLFDKLVNDGDEDGNTPFHLYPRRFSRMTYRPPLWCDRLALNAKGLTVKEETDSRHIFKIQFTDEAFIKRTTHPRRRKPSGAAAVVDRRAADDGKDKSGESEHFKLEIDSHLIVAALVATVAFAAGFTAPGGYDDKSGIAKLSDTFGFQCFIVCDALALMLSFSAILLYFISVYHIEMNKDLAYHLVFRANILTAFGMFSSVIAFVSAAALTTGSPQISGTIIVSGVMFFVFYYGLSMFRFRGYSFWGTYFFHSLSRFRRVTYSAAADPQ